MVATLSRGPEAPPRPRPSVPSCEIDIDPRLGSTFSVSSTYTIARGQREFAAMVKRAENGELAVVTRHDKPVAYVISAERMEGILETMELLANPEFIRTLEADRAGKTTYRDLHSVADD